MMPMTDLHAWHFKASAKCKLFLGRVIHFFDGEKNKNTKMLHWLLKAVGKVPKAEIYPPTNFWGVVLFLLPTLLCSLSITGGRSNVAMLLGSAMGLGSAVTSPRKFQTRKWLGKMETS